MNACSISDAEVVDMPLLNEDMILAKLKAKGAPILGLCLLRFDPSYTVHQNYDCANRETNFKWELTNAN